MSYTCAVITVSDKGARGERVDTSGPAICALAAAEGFTVVHTAIIPDEKEQIMRELIRCADEEKISLILTTGGTGFSPRDVTPEATLAVIERETSGIPEAMRWASLQITPRGCLSRSVAGIRGRSLIINLPGSEKAARENLSAVLPAVVHGMDMLASEGSADCAAADRHEHHHHEHRESAPSVDDWLRAARRDAAAADCGMFLIHNGVVRKSAKARVRAGDESAPEVKGLRFSFDAEKVEAAKQAALNMPGIKLVRVWLASGELKVGDDIMLVLVGGDIRPRVVDALQALVGELKSNCVTEEELY